MRALARQLAARRILLGLGLGGVLNVSGFLQGSSSCRRIALTNWHAFGIAVPLDRTNLFAGSDRG